MKRTILSLMSMVVVCAMTLMSCDELASIIDNPVSSYVQFPKSELTMEPGTQVQNTATTISTEKITYTTSDATVATVDQSGLITALAEGEATITASVPGNEYYAAGSATCLVKVRYALPTLATPLTFEVLTDGTITVAKPRAGMYYKKNGGDQVALTAGVDAIINVTKDDKVEFYGTATSYCKNDWSDYTTFGGTAEVKVYGNIMSLLSPTGFADNKMLTAINTFSLLFEGYTNLKDASNLFLPATTLADFCYNSMFSGCTSLTAAPKELPAESLAQECYGWMFSGCTSLTTAPELKASTLSPYCCFAMFQNCTSLTAAPELKAMTLASECYNSMFRNCTSLTAAPALPAETLTYQCYRDMFSGCTGLTTAPELKAMTLANNCYYSMFNGCTGLTTAPKELPATTLTYHCYNQMFKGCTALTTVPELPATELKSYCYNQMFKGCTALTTAPELPATTLGSNCYDQMFYGCTSLTTAYVKTAYDTHSCGNMFYGCTATGAKLHTTSANKALWSTHVPTNWDVEDDY